MEWFLYNRMWAVGVFTLMEGIGLEPTEEVNSVFCCCTFGFVFAFVWFGVVFSEGHGSAVGPLMAYPRDDGALL